MSKSRERQQRKKNVFAKEFIQFKGSCPTFSDFYFVGKVSTCIV